jgi:hypothetical protein
MLHLRSRINQELKIHDDMKAIIISTVTAPTKDGNWKPAMEAGLNLHKGLAAQARVGWFQLLYGRLAKGFVNCLVDSSADSSQASAEMYGKRLINIIGDLFLQMWRQCNDAVHGITEHTRKMAQIQALTLKVRRCYEQQYIMPIDDR